MDALEGLEPLDSDGSPEQLGDMVKAVNKNWEKMILGRLSSTGEKGNVYALIDGLHSSRSEAFDAG
jgi:hypothetical protein